jgi:hypothetical protein
MPDPSCALRLGMHQRLPVNAHRFVQRRHHDCSRPYLPSVSCPGDVVAPTLQVRRPCLPDDEVEGEGVPEGTFPLRVGKLETHLAIGHQTEVSTLSGRGDRCIPYPDHYSPAFACSVILYPQRIHHALRRDLSTSPRGSTPIRAYPVPCGEHESGGPRLSADDRLVSVPPPSREASGHVPFWLGPVSRFGPVNLTAFSSGSHVLVL